MRFVFVVCLVACAGANGPHGGNPGDDTPGMDGGIGDGVVMGDAPQTMPVTCGGATCQAGQTCVDNACTFACAGATVPGDYASIQTAVDALAAAGQDATICLGEATFNEQVTVRDQGGHQKTLRIVGKAMNRSIVNGQIYVQSGWSTVRLQGMQVKVTTGTALHAQGAGTNKLELLGVKVSGGTGIEAYQKQTIFVDGCEIAAVSGYGVSLYANSTSPLVVRVQNSYLHGGYSVRAANASGYEVQLTFVNNLIKGSQVGMDISGTTTAVIANNIFTGMTGTALQWAAPANVDRHDNALFANATNYGGLASDGANTIKQDCMLNNAAVPALGAGSPCRDKGDAAVAPMHDFYGTARGAAPDLGPIEN